MRNLCVIILLLCNAGCSVFAPIPNQALNTYTIDSTPTPQITGRSKITLLVPPMQASIPYNTNLMAYKMHPHQINYFAKNIWAATPAQMIHNLLVQTLQKTHYFANISAIPYLNHYNFTLNTQLLELQQNFCGATSSVTLKIYFQIIDNGKHKALISKIFKVTIRAPQLNPYGGVIAANQASAIILREISNLCVQTLR